MSPAKKRRDPESVMPSLPDTVRLSSEGLAKVLGDLESRIVREVWSLGVPSTARDIHDCVARTHELSPFTTITVLNRLVVKRVLQRTRIEGRLHFSARLNEADFMKQASRRVVEGILSLGADAVAASFVDVLAEQDPEQLQELARLVRQKLRAQRELSE